MVVRYNHLHTSERHLREKSIIKMSLLHDLFLSQSSMMHGGDEVRSFAAWSTFNPSFFFLREQRNHRLALAVKIILSDQYFTYADISITKCHRIENAFYQILLRQWFNTWKAQKMGNSIHALLNYSICYVDTIPKALRNNI